MIRRMCSHTLQRGINADYKACSLMTTHRKDPGEAELQSRSEAITHFMEKTWGEDVAKSARSAMQGNFAGRMCWHCTRLESALGDGEQLRSCSGCRKVGRIVLYCSQ